MCVCNDNHVFNGVSHLRISIPACSALLKCILTAVDGKAYLADLSSPLILDDPPLHLIIFSMCVSKAAFCAYTYIQYTSKCDHYFIQISMCSIMLQCGF